MIANTEERRFDVIEITNEMPLNRIGGVGSVIEALTTGFSALGINALWYVTDHQYRPRELDAILAGPAAVAFGDHRELASITAPVAHVHSYHHGPGLVDALSTRRSLFTVHSLLAYEELSNDVDLHDSVVEQERLIAACDEVTLVSAAEHEKYRQLGYERLNDRVSVIHNGVAAPRCPARRWDRRRMLGYCGRLVPRKHPEYVQMLLVEPEFADCEAMIAGKAFSLYARDLVARLGIEQRVHYLGWCGGPRLEAFYESIDVLVQPSTYEPFGLAALEAAARGIPIVCGEVDGLTELLGEHAYYCDPTSYTSFRAAVERWRTADPDALTSMTEAARLRALTEFSDVAMARRYAARFADLGVEQAVVAGE